MWGHLLAIQSRRSSNLFWPSSPLFLVCGFLPSSVILWSKCVQLVQVYDALVPHLCLVREKCWRETKSPPARCHLPLLVESLSRGILFPLRRSEDMIVHIISVAVPAILFQFLNEAILSAHSVTCAVVFSNTTHSSC